MDKNTSTSELEIQSSQLDLKDASASSGSLSAKEFSDQKAQYFTQYYLTIQPALSAYLTSLVHSHATVEDCLQETCLVLWDKQQAHWELEDFRKFAFTTARFKAMSWLKKNKPNTLVTLSPELTEQLAMAAAEDCSNSPSQQSDQMLALQKCLEALPAKQKELLESRYTSEKKEGIKLLASRQNKTVASIYKQVTRLRSALRDCVERRLTNS